METNLSELHYLLPGTALNGGKYIIEQMIGEGGFSITYKAKQTDLNRNVCIKEYFLAGFCVRNIKGGTVRPLGSNADRFQKYKSSFVTEAQTVASFDHPNIVKVIEIFDENNTTYMVMPFIDGYTLDGYVGKNGPLSYQDAVNYIAQIADAVGYIHERHYLHRDIKPKNIMITNDFKAILIDFGSARVFEEDKTQAYTSMYTDGYAPPEQYTRFSRMGAYSDIYALGATLYFILTQKEPMAATARVTETLPTPRELNPNLPSEANRTIMKAMQLNSLNRHQSISEFMDDLRNVKPSKPIRKRISNKLAIIIASIAFVFIVSIGMVVYLLTSEKNIDNNTAVNENTFDYALKSMNSTNIDTFYVGYKIMDSLSGKKYVPAMYEIVYTLGWYSNNESLRRKDILGIKYEEKNPRRLYLPLDDNVNRKTIFLMQNILDVKDSSYALKNADAAYRLAGYYANGIVLKRNPELALDYLNQAQNWAMLSGEDEAFLTEIIDAINSTKKINL